jgi:hypothetical protein
MRLWAVPARTLVKKSSLVCCRDLAETPRDLFLVSLRETIGHFQGMRGLFVRCGQVSVPVPVPVMRMVEAPGTATRSADKMPSRIPAICPTPRRGFVQAAGASVLRPLQAVSHRTGRSASHSVPSHASVDEFPLRERLLSSEPRLDFGTLLSEPPRTIHNGTPDALSSPRPQHLAIGRK